MSKSIRLLVLAATVSLWWSAAIESSMAGEAKPTYLLQSARRQGAIDRVVSVIEVAGVLKSPHKEKTEQSKLGVNATMVYDERTLEVPDGNEGPLRSVRYYDRAEAKIDLAETQFTPELAPEHRLMAVEIDKAKITLFSPKGILTRDELDLVDLMANSLLLERFLPPKPVAQGESWTHSDELIVAALGLDRTAKQTVKSTLTDIDDDSASIELSGRVDGAINGVTTRIEVKGKYRFDRKTGRIDWFGLLVHEDRDVGQIGPGLEVTARLRLQIAPRERSERLSDKVLAGVSFKPSDELTQLVHEPDRGGWRFQHDRRWFFTGSLPPLSFLRLIERGDFIAQCNIAELEQVEPGKQATLEEFQNDIKEALGDNFGEFVSAGQKANEQNYRVLKVVARGTTSGLPIEWRYYLIADEHGRQITLTFTVEGPLAERLGQLDQQMIATLRFDPPKVAANGASSR